VLTQFKLQSDTDGSDQATRDTTANPRMINWRSVWHTAKFFEVKPAIPFGFSKLYRSPGAASVPHVLPLIPQLPLCFILHTGFLVLSRLPREGTI